MKYYLTFVTLLTLFFSFGQSLIWNDSFENSSSDWDLAIQTGDNEANSNLWKISDAEGGVAPPECAEVNNGDNTLFVGCQDSSCAETRAVYNPGDGNSSVFVETNLRAAYTQPISTVEKYDLEFVFDWIGVGENGVDYAEIEYSIDGGATWSVFWTQTPGDTCETLEGEWAEETVPLPALAENQADLRFAFHWRNNNEKTDGMPSFAVNNLRLFSKANSPEPTANFSIDTNFICKGDCVSFSESSTGDPTSWNWTFEQGNPSISNEQNPSEVCFDSVGIFDITLTVSNTNGTDQTTRSITVMDIPEVEGFGDTIIDIGGAAELSAEFNDVGEFFWEPAEHLDYDDSLEVIATPYITTSFYPTLVGANGCPSRDTVLVVVNFEEIVEVPSAFSPNGDGLNDKLYVKGIGIISIEFKIFNRYGQMVYNSDDIEEGWDGTLNGEPLNQGVFVYTLEFDLINGQSGERSGNVTLVK